MAHNGILYNDDELKKKHKLPKTKIETDSYVAVQLIESQKQLSFQSIRYMAEKVEGSFSFSIMNAIKNAFGQVTGKQAEHFVVNTVDLRHGHKFRIDFNNENVLKNYILNLLECYGISDKVSLVVGCKGK